MNRILILALFSFLFIFCAEQETKKKVVQTYRKGAPKREVELAKDGKTHTYQRVFQEEGPVLMEGPIKNMKRNGEWTFYDYNGKIKSIRTYAEGTYNGRYEEYHPNGKVSLSGMYENGSRVGDWKRFDANGKEQIVSEEEKKEVVNPLTPDFSNEKIIEQHENGAVKTKIIYDELGTEKVGQKSYYEGGALQIQGSFENDKKEGKWTSYFEDGKTLSINYYNKGKFHGDYMLFYPNGAVKIEGEYNFGTQTGSWKAFDEDGTLLSHDFYGPDGALMDKIK
jgi:antitoxin component YwqK of YwqJK toxin-antitoxin module